MSRRAGGRSWPGTGDGIRRYMDPTFSRIACRYNFMTRALSFGQEQRWKKKAVRLIPQRADRGRMLDLACGTADFARRLRRAGFRAPVVGLDRNASMLEIAAERCAHLDDVHFVRGDIAAVPCPSGAFSAVTMGYALRYLPDLRPPLAEILRLLEPGGVLVCLDFGLPRNRLYRRLCFGYLWVFGSLWGRLLHGDARTYWHIVESLEAYPGQDAVKEALRTAGFQQVALHEQLGGIAAILTAVRPEGPGPC